MVRIAAIVTMLTLGALPVSAAAPTAEQKAEFHSVCMAISGDETLCTCKADAAMDLIDERFMGVVISSMKGGAPSNEDAAAYHTYVGQSNAICKPNY